eukprot:TRINITY_DN101064_c0_g1_i1.p1 TRINITY_DN101064_c0_g1~~TRINITY_DN101064_c0_g1_i1.p1  ORF type:complete len:479 (+),score=74.51 TRINITY_DN101064_c0_g1_i1:86-1438(+)
MLSHADCFNGVSGGRFPAAGHVQMRTAGLQMPFISTLLIGGSVLIVSGATTGQQLAAQPWVGQTAPVEDPHAQGLAQDLAHLRPTVWSNDTGPFSPAVCELPAASGHLTGICQDDVEGLRDKLDFCKEAVRYRACVPAHQPLWEGWDAAKKDKLIAGIFKDLVEKRIAKEQEVSLSKYVPIHFLANPDCVAAFKNVLCWYNFPKCGDSNRSLPLCRESCDRYFQACLFEPSDAAAGTFSACRANTVAENGIFGSNQPGPDQVLAEDTEVCPSTAAEAARIQIETPSPPWYTQWWGMAIIAVAGVFVLINIGNLLIAKGLRAWMLWAFIRVVTWPHRVWTRQPVTKGKTILRVLQGMLVLLLLYGLFLRFFPNSGGGLDRFKIKDANTTTTTTTFTPEMAMRKLSADIPLSPKQLKKLIAGCTCTGGASRCLDGADRFAVLFIGVLLHFYH